MKPDAYLLLVGDGPLRGEVECAAQSMGLATRVILVGSRSDAARLLMGAMDAFVFPSLYEGLGMALVEAQAAGLACFCSDVIPDEADVVSHSVHRLPLSLPARAWAEA